MNKQKLMDTENSTMVTRGKGDEGAVKGEGGQIYDDGGRYDFSGGGHTIQYTVDASLKCTLEIL